MDGDSEQPKRTAPSAQQWLFITGLGVFCGLVVSPVGWLIALVGAFGIAWRLLQDR